MLFFFAYVIFYLYLCPGIKLKNMKTWATNDAFAVCLTAEC